MTRFLIAAIALTFCALPASAQPSANQRFLFNYANNDAEYSIGLIEAPTCVTIWADDKEKKVPYLENPPKFGGIGEVCNIRRRDATTGDLFEINITFLRADREYLITRTREKIEETMREDYKDIPLEQMTLKYSAGTDTIKWGTLTGFSSDENNNFYYNAMHFLTGLSTITVVKAKFNVENKAFQDLYKNIVSTIKYTGK